MGFKKINSNIVGISKAINLRNDFKNPFINPPSKNSTKMGSKVSVINLDTQKMDVYTITCSENINIARGFISDISPIGSSLLGHGIGDTVIVNAPGGRIRYKIVDLRS